MISELTALVIMGVLFGASSLIRWRHRALGRRLFLAVLAVGMAVALLHGPLIDTGKGNAPSRLVIVLDGSHSQGADLGARFAPRSLLGAFKGPVTVILAGAHDARLLYRGDSGALPQRFEFTSAMLSNERRSGFSLKAALALDEESSASSKGSPAASSRRHLVIASDGGFVLEDVRRALAKSATGFETLRAVQHPIHAPDDIGLRLVGEVPPTPFGGTAVIELEVFGRLTKARRVGVTVAGIPRQEVRLDPLRDRERLRVVLAPRRSGDEEIVVELEGHEGFDRDSTFDRLRLKWPLPQNVTKIALMGEDRARLNELAQRWRAIDPQQPVDIVEDVNDLGPFDCLFALDLGPAASRRDRALLAWVRRGGGLCLAGADRAFGLAGWDRSILDDLSPLKSQPARDALRLNVLIDRSGSMERGGRLAAAKTAVLALFDGLNDGDHLRVGLFNESLDLGPWRTKDARDEVRTRLSQRGARGATHLAQALQTLLSEPNPGERSRLLILTDGRDPELRDSERVDALLAKARASQLGIDVFWFDRQPENRLVLERLVAAGKGQLVLIDDFARLPQAFFESAQRELIVEPCAFRDSEGVLCQVDRLLRTRRGKGVDVLNAAGTDRNALARWRIGTGQVAAMPIRYSQDLADLILPEGGERSWLGFLRSLPSEKRAGSWRLRWRAAGSGGFLVVEGQGEEKPHGLVTSKATVPLTRAGLARHESPRFDRAPAADWYTITGADGQVLTKAWFAGAPREDLDPRPDLQKLSVVSSWAEKFGPISSEKRSGPPWPLLLLLFAILVADLGLRARGL